MGRALCPGTDVSGSSRRGPEGCPQSRDFLRLLSLIFQGHLEADLAWLNLQKTAASADILARGPRPLTEQSDNKYLLF